MSTVPRRDFAPLCPAPLSGVADGVLLTARDDLDLDTAGTAFRTALEVIAGGARAVVVDLAGVFVGAAAIRLLTEIHDLAAAAAVPLAITGAPPWLPGSALRLGVPQLRFHPTLAAALLALADDDPAGDNPAAVRAGG